jgi:hypothetical protein
MNIIKISLAIILLYVLPAFIMWEISKRTVTRDLASRREATMLVLTPGINLVGVIGMTAIAVVEKIFETAENLLYGELEAEKYDN